jgi:peroxiredoxin
MKKQLLFIAIGLLSMACSGTRVINLPEVMATNTRSLEIARIELTDSTTVLCMDAYNLPGNWIRIVSESFIEGNVTGKKYKLLRSEGFELDAEVSMPESGNVPFKLYFEPLDKRETAIEFVEGYDEGAFVMSGIQLREPDTKGKIRCHISGTVIDRPQSSRLMLMSWDTDFRVAPWKSIPIVDGKFDYTFYADAEEAYDLVFYEEPLGGSWLPIPFFVEAGDIEFTLFPEDRGYEENTVSTDAPMNALLKDFDRQEKETFSDRQQALWLEFNELQEQGRYYSAEGDKWMEDIRNADDEKMDRLYRLKDELTQSGAMYSEEGRALNERRNQLDAEHGSWMLQSIGANPSLPAYYKLVSSVDMAIQMNKYNHAGIDLSPYFTLYEELFKNQYPDHPYTQKMEMYISGNSIAVGGRYIDFTAPDASGKEFRLSEQIEGKFALIDLWASWCGPCRRSSMSMISVYEKYKERGFTVVGVAREEAVEDMTRAVEQDGYPWLNLLELKDSNALWQKYGVGNAGGRTFLVDRTGTILAVSPTAEEVVAILEEQL